MRCGISVTLIVLIVGAIPVGAVQHEILQGVVLDNETTEYWVDPGTGLMWAGKDNGMDITWTKAVKYCRDLRVAGYTDWRLPSLGELEASTIRMRMLPV